MSGRHARTTEPPSTAGTFLERASRRPVRVAALIAAGIALAAQVVAAEPMATPTAVEYVQLDRSIANLTLAVDEHAVRRHVAPGEGSVNTIGLATILAGNHSSDQVEASASYLAASMIAERRAAEQAAADKAAAERAAAERAAAERAAAEGAAVERSTAPAGGVWDRLAQCESGGNWAINTGNGYYGGLQFSLSSWRAVGGAGYPHEASRETQIEMGERLRANGGWRHWPACSRKLGLR